MLIPVIYCDHAHDIVEAITITSLIRMGKIKAFKQESGWVIIGRDQVRKCDYIGRERAGAESVHESDLPGMREGDL